MFFPQRLTFSNLSLKHEIHFFVIIQPKNCPASDTSHLSRQSSSLRTKRRFSNYVRRVLNHWAEVSFDTPKAIVCRRRLSSAGPFLASPLFNISDRRRKSHGVIAYIVRAALHNMAPVTGGATTAGILGSYYSDKSSQSNLMRNLPRFRYYPLALSSVNELKWRRREVANCQPKEKCGWEARGDDGEGPEGWEGDIKKWWHSSLTTKIKKRDGIRRMRVGAEGGVGCGKRVWEETWWWPAFENTMVDDGEIVERRNWRDYSRPRVSFISALAHTHAHILSYFL